MSKKYLLPCSCGEQITIDVSQAGQTLNCRACGTTVEVPTMRSVRELEPAPEPVEEKPAPKWSPLQGTLFASGIIVALISLAISGFVWMKRWELSARTAKPALPDTTLSDTQFEQMTADQVLDLWTNVIEKENLRYWEKPDYLVARQESRVWLVFQLVSLIVAVGGAATAVAAFMKTPNP